MHPLWKMQMLLGANWVSCHQCLSIHQFKDIAFPYSLAKIGVAEGIL